MKANTITLACILLCTSFAAAAEGSTDILPGAGIKIGGPIGSGGKFVPWGGSVVLSESDAFLQSNGRCAFNVSYEMKNGGTRAAAIPFRNTLLAQSAAVAINSNLTLGAQESRRVDTQPYLPQGDFQLTLRLDSDNQVQESNEANNEASIKVSFKGACLGKTADGKSDTQSGSQTSDNKTTPSGDTKTAPSGDNKTVPSGDSKTGTTGDNKTGNTGDNKTDDKGKPTTPRAELHAIKALIIGGKTVAWGGSANLEASDILLAANGKCAFNVTYQIENTGSAAASGFANRFLVGSTPVAENSNLSLAAAANTTIKTQLYLTPNNNVLTLLLDSGNKVAELDKNNNVTQVKLNVANACDGKKSDGTGSSSGSTGSGSSTGSKPTDPPKSDSGSKPSDPPKSGSGSTGSGSSTGSKPTDPPKSDSGNSGSSSGSKPTETPKPELHALKNVVLGSKTVAWGGSVEISDADIVQIANGKCAAYLSYQVENSGKANATGFAVKYAVEGGSAVESIPLNLNAGATLGFKTLVWFSPKSNKLGLLVDSSNKVAEMDESNNQAQLTVNINSACSGSKGGDVKK